MKLHALMLSFNSFSTAIKLYSNQSNTQPVSRTQRHNNIKDTIISQRHFVRTVAVELPGVPKKCSRLKNHQNLISQPICNFLFFSHRTRTKLFSKI